MQVTTQNAKRLLEPGLAKVVFEQGGGDDLRSSGIIKVQGPEFTPYGDRVTTMRAGGFGTMFNRVEDGTITFDTPWFEKEKTTYVRLFAIAVRFGELIWKNDRYGIMKQAAAAIRDSYPYTQNEDIAGMFDDFTDSTAYNSPDGEALGSIEHSSSTGNDRANILADPEAFSYETLAKLRRLHRSYRDFRGVPKPLGTKELICMVPTALSDEAVRLLSPMSRFEPDTNNNAVNYLLEGTRWRILENPYLMNSNQFFVISPKDVDIHLVNLQPLTPNSYIDERNNYGYVFDARSQHLIHAAAWQGITSTGTAIVG